MKSILAGFCKMVKGNSMIKQQHFKSINAIAKTFTLEPHKSSHKGPTRPMIPPASRPRTVGTVKVVGTAIRTVFSNISTFLLHCQSRNVRYVPSVMSVTQNY